ncbi:MAG: Glycerol-3-phosphate dehydrogenase, partial [Verrucomicrobiota bacterium]
ANEIRALKRIMERGFVYRGLKPVYWCFDCGSSLAEFEIEYADKKSQTLDVGFACAEPDKLAAAFGPIPVATLSGPSNADEVARGMPTAMVLAAHQDDETLREVQAALSGPTLRAYTSSDLPGVEIGGTLKNVYAVGAGLCDGLGLGSNAKAAFLTRALQEMMRVGVAVGGRPETFLGLGGVGDLMATAHGGWSRNRSFGEQVAQDAAGAITALETRRDSVEGYRATDTLTRMAKASQLNAPILFCLHRILFEGLDARAGVTALMTRDLKPEA